VVVSPELLDALIKGRMRKGWKKNSNERNEYEESSQGKTFSDCFGRKNLRFETGNSTGSKQMNTWRPHVRDRMNGP